MADNLENMTAARDEAIKTVSSLAGSLGRALTDLKASEAARERLKTALKSVMPHGLVEAIDSEPTEGARTTPAVVHGHSGP